MLKKKDRTGFDAKYLHLRDEILKLLDEDYTKGSIAKHFGMSRPTLNRVINKDYVECKDDC